VDLAGSFGVKLFPFQTLYIINKYQLILSTLLTGHHYYVELPFPVDEKFLRTGGPENIVDAGGSLVW
jgi:hypothetical protein